MARGTAWPEKHIELLRRAVLEKRMPLEDLRKLFPHRTESAIRCQLSRQDLPVIHHYPEPDMDFFDSYGLDESPELKRG